MQFARIDEVTGIFLTDVVVKSAPTLDNGAPDPTYIPGPADAGFYLPRWNGTKWVEGGAAPEPVPPVQTPEERIAELEAVVADLMTAMEALV